MNKQGLFMVKKKIKFNPYLLLILSFMGVVLVGSFLLSMPFAFNNNPNHEWCHVGSYLDAFFTSLAAMTLTGITTYPEGLANTLSLSGQIIVLVLVQIGGLGIVTFLTFFFAAITLASTEAFLDFGEGWVFPIPVSLLPSFFSRTSSISVIASGL